MKVRQILSIHNLTFPIVSRAALPLPLPNDNDNTSLAQPFPSLSNSKTCNKFSVT